MPSQEPPQKTQVISEHKISVPVHYFNGFINSLGDSDVHSILLLDGQPVAKINMSFSTAKTLAKLLQDLITTLESVSTHPIMTTTEIATGLEKIRQQEHPKK